MTLEEKAGQLFHGMIQPGPDGQLSQSELEYSVPGSVSLLLQENLRPTAEWHNRLQRRAVRQTRLGVPITLSAVPRSHFTQTAGAARARAP